jgi:hypothetical protein
LYTEYSILIKLWVVKGCFSHQKYHYLVDSQKRSESFSGGIVEIESECARALNLAALTKPTSQSGPYREFLGKGETPVERGALADLSQDGSVKLPSARQEPDTKDGLSING